MRTFQQFVALTENFINYGDYNLQQKFQHFNSTLFDNKVPPCPIEWDSTLHRVFGVTTFRHMGRILVKDSLRIRISTHYQRTERMVDSTVIHEMIHAYLAASGRPDENHGIFFKSMAHSLGQKVGIEIPVTDSVTDLELSVEKSDPITALLHKSTTGKWTAQFFKNNAFDSPGSMNQLISHWGSPGSIKGEDVLVMKVVSSLGNKYKMTREVTSPKWYVIRDDEAEGLLRSGTIIHRITPGSANQDFVSQNQKLADVVVLLRKNRTNGHMEVTFYQPFVSRDAKALDILQGKGRYFANVYGYETSLFSTKSSLFNHRRFSMKRNPKDTAYYVLKPEEVQELLQNAKMIQHWTAGSAAA